MEDGQSQTKMELQMKNAYKIKSTTVDPKALRLRRRSVDWKNNRLNEANKGRNLQNLSPLQELTSKFANDNIAPYEGKTPIKGDTTGGHGKRKMKTVDDVKKELVKWKREKELKRKLEKEKQLRKPSFKVHHMEHEDTYLYKKRMEAARCTRAFTSSVMSKNKPAPLVTSNNLNKEYPSATTNKAYSSVTKNKPSATKSTSVATNKPKPNKPSSRIAAEKRTSEKAAVTQKQPASNKPVTGKKAKQAVLEKLDLKKVSTTRGVSFAPQDFTFSAPHNITTFEFKPLSPTSTAQFLYPATTSFIGTDPKRCSTPKSVASGGPVPVPKDYEISLQDISKVSNCYGRRTTRSSAKALTEESVSKDCGISLQDISKVSSSSGRRTTRTSAKAVTKTKKMLVDEEKSMNNDVILSRIATDWKLSTATDRVNVSETRRVTRGMRQSLLGTPATPRHTEALMAVNSTQATDTGANTCSHENMDVDGESTTDMAAGETDTDAKSERNTSVLDTGENSQLTEKTKKALPQRLTRSLRRSLCLSSPSESLLSEKPTPRKSPSRSRRSVSVPIETTMEKVYDDEVFSTSPVKNNDNTSKKTPSRNRRTMSNLSPFHVPSNDSMVLSCSRSKRKRRKSHHDRPINPKSPEEWVKLLKCSPMVEMCRRTPKTIPIEKEPLIALDLDMDIDEDLSVARASVNDTTLATVIEPAGVSLVPGNDDNTLLSIRAAIDQDPPSALSDPACDSRLAVPTPERLVMSQPHDHVKSKDLEDKEPEDHTVTYFRQLMVTEVRTLNEYCSTWEHINTTTHNLREEVKGQIRTCIGQAQLLMDQRFKQFTGLVDNCEFGTGDKETTCTDLQGFWDMIFYQVEDVHTKFANLEKLQANNWIMDKPPVKKIVKKKVAAKPAVKRPAATSKFSAFRAQMKKKETVPDILCHEDSTVTFDGGFFKVSSPKKTPTFHCEAGSPKPVSTAKDQVAPQQPKITPPVLGVLSTAVEPSPLTSIRTPRRSYVPVNPSPLLQDITPKACSKARRTERRSIPKRLCSGVDVVQEEVPNKENEDVDNGCGDAIMPAKSAEVSQAEESASTPSIVTPKAKITPRRSLRSRRSLSDTMSPQVQQTEDNSDFFKYLQPTSTATTTMPSNGSVLDNDEEPWDISAALSADSSVVSRQHRSSLKQLPSQQRRRSTRRSVHFSSSPRKTMLGSEDEASELFTPPEQTSCVSLGEFSQHAGFTPAYRSARPSLLYTPPKHTSSMNHTVAEIPTGTLICFTP